MEDTLRISGGQRPGTPNLTRREDVNYVHVTITVEDFVNLGTARTISFNFELSTTIEEALTKSVSKKIWLNESQMSDFGLFMQPKGKQLENSKTFFQSGYKPKDRVELILKRLDKRLITLTIYFEEKSASGKDRKPDSFRTYNDTFTVNSTVQEVLDKISQKEPDKIRPDKEDSCALFLPTRKSKKGIYLERDKKLKDYNMSNKATLVLKIREEEEIVLTVEIENHTELNCAKSVTTFFNSNITVQEAIQKIARRGNVFIDDIAKYRMLKDGKVLKTTETLASFNLNNKDTLHLQKKSNLSFGIDTLSRRASLSLKIAHGASSPSTHPQFPNVIILGEKGSNKKEIFYSQANESIFRSLSRRVLDPSDMQAPHHPAFPRRTTSLEQVPSPTDKVPDPNNNGNVSVTEITPENSHEHSSEPTEDNEDERPRAKARKPGALPRRETKGRPPSEAEWQLVRIYHQPDRFWTLALFKECTVKELLRSIMDRVDRPVAVSLTLIDNDSNFNISKSKKLQDEEILAEVKKGFSYPDEFIFFVTQEDIEATSDSTTPNSENVLEKSTEKSENGELIPDELKDLKSLNHKPRTSSGSGPGVVIIDNNETIDVWLNPRDVEKERKLSKGAFAKVYLGTFKGKQVAIKTILGDTLTAVQIHSFKSELQILCSVKSPYLVEFIGAYILDNRPSIVMEFCPNGSLYDVLNNKEMSITWDKTLHWMIQTCEGVDALHNLEPVPLVHRDIKSLNLLLDAEFNIKVCDFGLSRFRTMTHLISLAELRGTMAYCAPEIYDGHIFSTKSDIYSIGIVFWELVMRTMTGEYKRPFEEFDEICFEFQIIVATNKQKKRPTIPSQCPPALVTLIQTCWDPEPEKRPACTEILETLQTLKGQHDQDKESWGKSISEKVVNTQ